MLEARQSYISGLAPGLTNEPLNVDLLASVLDSLLPKANRFEPEPYAILLPDLLHFGIDSSEKLTKLIKTHLKFALEEDSRHVARYADADFSSEMASRIANGAYLAHVGLVRAMLRKEFGDEYSLYARKRFRSNKPSSQSTVATKGGRKRSGAVKALTKKK